MTMTAKVENEGAEIVFDYEGQGPLLLTIAGGGGSGARYAGISEILKDEYTVVRFDRRCQSRSTGDASKQLDMAQQARDAAAIIKEMNAGPAYVFGNSSGACIALKLAEDCPELLCGVIAHEPPAFALLPDAVELYAFGDKVVEIFKAQGSGPAMGFFMSKMVGFTRPIAEESGARIGDQSAAHNMDYFLKREIHNVSRYAPDLLLIKDNKAKIAMVEGKASEGAYYARTTKVIAERLGCPHYVISGNHIPFVIDPATCAEELRPILKAFESQTA